MKRRRKGGTGEGCSMLESGTHSLLLIKEHIIQGGPSQVQEEAEKGGSSPLSPFLDPLGSAVSSLPLLCPPARFPALLFILGKMQRRN